MKSLLFVEDDKNISLAFSARLKASGYAVQTASDAVSAVSQARAQRPDLVILDISLPAGDGFTVAERIRNLEGLHHVPLLFITASRNPGLRERAEALGAKAFLRKPFDALDLLQAVSKGLREGSELEFPPLPTIDTPPAPPVH